MDEGFSPQGYRVTITVCATTLFFNNLLLRMHLYAIIVLEYVHSFV